MAQLKNIDFKPGVLDINKQFCELKIDTTGVELISKLLNDVNQYIIASIDAQFKQALIVDRQKFLEFAQVSTNNFPAQLAKNGLCEAGKQVALLQSGCMANGQTTTKKKKPPSSHNKNIIQAPAPKKSVFAPLLNPTIHGQFDNAVVVLDKEASNSSGRTLEDVCEALVKVALSRAENSGKLGQEQVVEAVCQVFPKQLADHSIASGSNRNES
ncbi:hypothetical protein AVEN_136094-1 [Araneus ventricosus]|uniref:Uncharacterized protein n=1 Tax=Araneus ventricosus TaxID=182803 RepID=A0A4Y2N8I8_ARAVE|nr:hypothetical protein AVEN_136094-1 [Araneus ventricosus]